MVKKALLGELSDNELRLLRVYKAVVECGGFAAAELELNINRSTISRHIKELELRLGISLCRRGRSGFALSAEGQSIYEATLRLLASLEEFRSEVNEVNQRLTGKLVLALFDKTVTNPEAAISQALGRFDQLAPDVKLEIYVGTINEIERGVMEGRFHLGVIPIHRPSSSLHYHPLFDEQMYLYCGHRHPLFAVADGELGRSDILGHKYAGLGYHSPNMEAGHHQQLVRAATAYDQEAVASLILSGRYLGYLPDHYADNFEAQGLMRHLMPETFQYRCQFNAIVRQSSKPSRVVDSFLTLLSQCHGAPGSAGE